MSPRPYSGCVGGYPAALWQTAQCTLGNAVFNRLPNFLLQSTLARYKWRQCFHVPTHRNHLQTSRVKCVNISHYDLNTTSDPSASATTLGLWRVSRAESFMIVIQAWTTSDPNLTVTLKPLRLISIQKSLLFVNHLDTLSTTVWGQLEFLKEVSSAHKGCIYLIKNIVKTVILWIITITDLLETVIKKIQDYFMTRKFIRTALIWNRNLL